VPFPGISIGLGGKRLLKRAKAPLTLPVQANNSTWSIDFMMDRLYCGKAFKVLNIIDDFNRGSTSHRTSSC